MEKRIYFDQLQDLMLNARHSDRGRANLNTHDSLDAAVQRLFIATAPDTYIRPHRHSEANKWEFFVLLEGAMDLLIFDEIGTIIERSRMSRFELRAVEIPPGQWHSYACSEPGTLALEIKQDAYIPTPAEDFAHWAPAEGAPEAQRFLAWMRDAEVGTGPHRLPT